MPDEETKGGFKVSDKRRFSVDETGKVVAREGEPGMTSEPAADAATQAKETFETECEPCRTDFAELPPIDFMSFIFSLSTSTMICLGTLPDPQTRQDAVDLAMAKQNIDILGMLQDKTRGNLTEEEEGFLNDALYDLRLRFVEACRKAAPVA
jgi:hypothetical protein